MSRALRVGSTVLGVLVVGTLAAVAAPRALAKPTHSVRIDFPTASGLVPGSDVFEAGAKVGTVGSIQPTMDNRALITVQISDEHWPLHQGVTAGIRPKSLLGEKYVDIHDGKTSGPAYNASATIRAADNSTPVELDQFINSLDGDTRSAAKILLNDLGAGVAGRGADLNSAIATGRANLDHLAQFGTTLNNRDPDLDRILLGLDGLLQKLTQDDQLNQMSQLIGNGQQTLNAIEAESTSFKRQFVDAEAVLAEFNTAVDPAVSNLRDLFATAPDLLTQLHTEADLLAYAGQVETSGSGLAQLQNALVGGPTASGGGLEKLSSPKDGVTYAPIFRVCLLNPFQSSCTGHHQFEGPGPQPAGYYASGADEMATLAGFIGL